MHYQYPTINVMTGLALALAPRERGGPRGEKEGGRGGGEGEELQCVLTVVTDYCIRHSFPNFAT